jgi:hypothetical protein
MAPCCTENPARCNIGSFVLCCSEFGNIPISGSTESDTGDSHVLLSREGSSLSFHFMHCDCEIHERPSFLSRTNMGV